MKKFIKVMALVMALVMTMSSVCLGNVSLSDKTVTIDVTATGGGKVYNGDRDWSVLMGYDEERGTEITLEAVESKGKFVYWKDNVTGRIVSYDPIYTFTVIDNISLTAMFVYNIHLESNAYLTFADTNGRIFWSNFIADGEGVREPDTSYINKPGYNLVGWDSDAWKAVSAGEIYIIKTVYEENDEAYELSVSGGIIEPEMEEYSYDSEVLITLDKALIPKGRKFGGFMVNDELLTMDESFKWRVSGNAAFEAVYVEEAAEKNPMATLVDIKSLGTTVSMLAYRTADEPYEIIEAGILYTTSQTGDILHDGTGVKKAKAIDKDLKGFYRFNMSLGQGSQVRAKAYIIYKKDNSLYITYSEEKEFRNS